MARAQATTSHDKIRKWVESRGGHPAAVKATRRAGSPGGLLRIDFDPKDESLEELPWDEFFQAFDGNELAFLYQDQTSEGKTSRFFKFVDRNTLDEDTLNASEDDEDLDEDEDSADYEEDDDDEYDDDEDFDEDDEDDEDLDEDEDEDEEPSRGKKK